MKDTRSRIFRLLARLDRNIRMPQFIRRRIEKYSVASKINFIILAAVLPMLFILSVIFLVLFFQINSQIESTLLQKMISARNAYNFHERNTLTYARMLAENTAIKKELLADTINVGPILRVCRQAQSGSALNRITVYDSKGTVIVRSHSPTEFGDDASRQPQIAHVLKTGESAAALISENDRLVLQNTVPIRFENDRIGLVSAGYVLDHTFLRTLADLTQSGVFMVANSRLQASSFSADIDAPTAVYEAQNTDYSLSRRLTYRDKNNVVRSEQMDFRFIPIATPVRSEGVTNPGLAVALKPAYPRLLLYAMFWGGFILILLVIFLGILLSFKIGHKIADYASTVSGAMERFTEGEHDVRIDGVSDDELGKVARAFNQMAAELQRRIRYIHDTNESLAALIAERTQDLGEALNRVTRLEEMQQGDYLLMSLLLKPLGAADTSLGRLTASALTDQKKRYSFKGNSGQIGGDFCLFAPLTFRGLRSKWLFFFNGDAMGKSSQGAAGALVCAVTLQSILARSSGGKPIAARPEAWLRSVYNELDHIFSLFKGSMNMTAAFGLVNSQNGQALFINAEHPPLVLYRDKQARYIEDVTRVRKPGGTGKAAIAKIRALRLKAGDIIFAGSDGKDDLETANGIESDDARFLRIVQAARGDLQTVRHGLGAAGTVTDDLSLVRIALA